MHYIARNFIGSFYDKNEVNTFRQQAYLAFLTSTPFTHIIIHMDKMQKYGTDFFVMYHALCVICIAMPLFIMYQILGVLLKKSFLTIWDICPLVKGISVCVCLNIIYNCCIHLSFVSQQLMFIKSVFKVTLDINDCNFPEATKKCVGVNPLSNFSTECCPTRKNCQVEFMFSTLEWYRSFYFGDAEMVYLSPRSSLFRVDWIVVCAIVWFLVIFIVFLDISRYKHCIKFCTHYYGFLFFCLVVATILISTKTLCPKNLQSEMTSFKTPALYLEIIMHAVYYERPGEHLFLSSMADVRVNPLSLASTIFIMKIIVLNVFGAWLAIGHRFIQENYKVHDDYCLHMSGKDIWFGVFPDLMMRTGFPQMYLVIFFFTVGFYCFQSVVIMQSCLVKSVISSFPSLSEKRLFVVVVSSGICFAILIALQIRTFHTYVLYWRLSSFWALGMLNVCAAFAGIALYGFQRISNDYYFLYGYEAKYYSTVGFKFATYIFTIHFVIFLLYFHNIKTDSEKLNNIYLDKGLVFSTMCPFVACALFLILKSIIMKKNFLTSKHDVGPQDVELFMARTNFAPQKKCRFHYNQVSCLHHCLLNSQKLDESKYCLARKAELLENFYFEDMRSHSSNMRLQFIHSSTQFRQLHFEFKAKRRQMEQEVEYLKELEKEHITEYEKPK